MPPIVFEQNHMDTRVTCTVYPGELGAAAGEWAERAFARFADMERRFSLFRQDSEIRAVNAAAGRPTATSADFREALRYALVVAASSGGLFDPLVGRWTVPGGDLGGPSVSYRDIDVDDANGTVTLPSGATLDLNAVIKGWAIDQAVAEFAGADAVMVEAGGDLRISGLPPGQAAWRIGIRDPAKPSAVCAVVPVCAGAVCTSGDYFRASGARNAGHYHLVDGRTGRPAARLASLTVLAPTARQADALSTAAYGFAPVAASAFVESHADCSCLFVTTDGRIGASPRLAAILDKISCLSAA